MLEQEICRQRMKIGIRVRCCPMFLAIPLGPTGANSSCLPSHCSHAQPPMPITQCTAHVFVSQTLTSWSAEPVTNSPVSTGYHTTLVTYRAAGSANTNSSPAGLPLP